MIRRSRRRRGNPALWFTPLGVIAIVLVGAIAYIAYRANLGLPWQSRYEIFVQVPDADRLISAADVRIGGVLVGEVVSREAEPGKVGQPPYARLKLALSNSVGRLPVDSTVQVRPASVLGLTYVDLHLGHDRSTVPPGGTLPLARALPSADLTDLFDIFDRSAARSFQQATAGLAYGFAGRGAQVNAAIASTAHLLPAAQQVASTLSEPTTRLGLFLHAYQRFVGALSPVAAQFAELVADADITFGALAGVRPALGAAIDAAPAAERAVTIAFTAVRPALDGLAQLSSALRPAGRLLPRTLAQINTTLVAAVKPLRDLPSFARPLRSALRRLEAFARDPSTMGSLRKLHDLILPTNQVLAAFTPAQEFCDVLGLWGVNFSSTFGAVGDGVGPSLPNLVITGAGALGEELQNAKPSPNLATNPYPNEVQGDCESGNETFSGRQQLNNLPNFHSAANRWTTPPPGVTALAQAAGLLKPIPGIK